MTTTPIAVVEPQMHGIFHAPFNAAFLHAIVLAFPNTTVSFRALPSHAAAVRSILEEHAPPVIAAVEWRSISTSTATSIAARWLANRKLLKQALAPKERLIFTSISRLQLLQLKRLMDPCDQAFAVLHGDLDRIESPAPERFPASLFALQRVLLKPQPRGLRFILLGQSIRDKIPSHFDSPMSNAAVIDHPYHFSPLEGSPRNADTPPVVGIFGNTGDGRLLECVARAVKVANPEIVFRLVGFLADEEAAQRLQPFVEGTGHRPLSREEFLRRARSVDYALWLAPPGSFRLRASGTFFDALAHGKPLVFTANAFIDWYYATDPEIGIRCRTVEEVSLAVLHLASSHNRAAYASAQASIATLRQRFTPESLALKLPALLGWQ